LNFGAEETIKAMNPICIDATTEKHDDQILEKTVDIVDTSSTAKLVTLQARC
jgi:hypothetical protein